MNLQVTTHRKFALLAVIVALALALTLTTSFAPKAHAAEINPPADSYSFGSTSEFSPYSTLGQGSNSSLAPTGENMVIGYIVIVMLLVIAGGATYVLVRNKKHASKSDKISS